MFKLPTIHQWQKLPSVLNKKERYFIIGFAILAILSCSSWIIVHRLNTTVVAPAYGGSFSEGIVGNPQYINPILSQANDSDRDVTELIFSGLTKYNSKGEIVPNLAEKYSIGDNGKLYEFFLRKDVKWHDGKPFNADDVIFTINTIQNPDFRSPLRVNWVGVEVERVDDYTIKFTLKNAYAPFLANTTIGIIAKHIWEKIPSTDFSLSPENLNPVGTGPYKLNKIKKDNEGFINYINLKAFGDARKRGSQILVITSGGKLEKIANQDDLPCLDIPASFPPRCALGYSFFPLLLVLAKIGVIRDQAAFIDDAIHNLRELKDSRIGYKVPKKNNLAKRIAGEIFGRLPVIYAGHDHIDAVVTRWRGQLAENSKTLSWGHLFPEMNHNEIVGWENPKRVLEECVAIILRDAADHPRVSGRMDITKRILKDNKIKVLEVSSAGKGLLARILSLVYIGDFVSFYLAILNGIDPTPVERIKIIKRELAKR